MPTPLKKRQKPENVNHEPVASNETWREEEQQPAQAQVPEAVQPPVQAQVQQQPPTAEAPASSGWYMTGSEAQVEVKVEQERNKRQPFRIWLREGESADVVFLDDEGFAFYEHELKIAGNWGNYYTCSRGVDPKGCPLCKHHGPAHRYLITLRTIIDLRPYTIKSTGELRDWTLKILATKQRSNNIVEIRRKQLGTLVGAKMQITRTSKKVEKCGDDFAYIKDGVDLTQFTWKDKQSGEMKTAAPYNYPDVYAPKPYDLLASLLADSEVQEAQQYDMDDNIKF